MIVFLTVAAVTGLLALLAAGLQGLRDGDRPLDITVRAAPPRAGSAGAGSSGSWSAVAGSTGGWSAVAGSTGGWSAGAGHPDGAPRAVLAWVHNPGPVPVLVGLSVRRRRLPDWLSPALTVRVPWRTRRPKFGPQAQDTVGVLAPGASEGWPVAAPATGRRGRLVAVAGQADGRLRVITLAVSLTPAGSAPWPARRRPASRRPARH